jgi:hypothetical protein
VSYKSNPRQVLLDFFRLVVVIFLYEIVMFAIVFWLLLENKIIRPYLNWVPFAVFTVIAVCLAAIFAFSQHNITAVVSPADIRFYRKDKEFQVFSFDEYSFSSNIILTRARGASFGVTRFLNATPRNGGKAVSQRCFNFDQNTFEAFYALVRTYNKSDQGASPAFDQQPQQGKPAFDQQPDQQSGFSPGTRYHFRPNKQALINRYGVPFRISLGMAIGFPALLAVLMLTFGKNSPSLTVGSTILTNLSLAAALVLLIVLTQGKPLQAIRGQMPESIELYPDRIILDNQSFYFANFAQIKVTPPSYQQVKKGTLRSLILVSSSQTISIVVGDAKDSYATNKPDKPQGFAEYEEFCRVLEAMLASQPGKFLYDLG